MRNRGAGDQSGSVMVRMTAFVRMCDYDVRALRSQIFGKACSQCRSCVNCLLVNTPEPGDLVWRNSRARERTLRFGPSHCGIFFARIVRVRRPELSVKWRAISQIDNISLRNFR